MCNHQNYLQLKAQKQARKRAEEEAQAAEAAEAQAVASVAQAAQQQASTPLAHQALADAPTPRSPAPAIPQDVLVLVYHGKVLVAQAVAAYHAGAALPTQLSEAQFVAERLEAVYATYPALRNWN